MADRTHRFALLCCALFLTLLTSLRAGAQPNNAAVAQGLFDEARTLMAAKRWAEACPKLEESQRLDPASGTLINLAKCYENAGRIASAWSTYLDAAAAAKATANAERAKKARSDATRLAPRVSKISIDVPEASRLPGLEVFRDGVPLNAPAWGSAAPADAGEHAIEARAPGYQPFTERVVVNGEGNTLAVTIPQLVPVPAPSPEPPPPAPVSTVSPPKEEVKPARGLPPQRVLALVSGGVGVAGLAVGTIFGIQAISDANQAEEACSGSACTTSAGAEAGNDARAAGNVATVGMIVAAVGISAGLVLWFTAPAESSSPRVGLGLDRVVLEGAF
jgi:hypothetical protein